MGNYEGKIMNIRITNECAISYNKEDRVPCGNITTRITALLKSTISNIDNTMFSCHNICTV